MVNKLEIIAKTILKLKLKKSTYWYNKATIFSLIIACYNHFDELKDSDIQDLKYNLEAFEKDLPTEFELAAKEGVNNKKERLIRNKYVVDIIKNSIN